MKKKSGNELKFLKSLEYIHVSVCVEVISEKVKKCSAIQLKRTFSSEKLSTRIC